MIKKENLFKVTKEKRYSRFDKATMIIEKDRGKGTTKRFLLDHNASEIMELEPGSELGFILFQGFPGALIADISNMDKTEMDLSSEDINVINKTKIKFDEYPEDTFTYFTFTNRTLKNRLLEEYETSDDYSQRFNLTVLPETEEFKATLEYLSSIGVTKVFYLEYAGQINQYRGIGRKAVRRERPSKGTSFSDYLEEATSYYDYTFNSPVAKGYVEDDPHGGVTANIPTEADDRAGSL